MCTVRLTCTFEDQQILSRAVPYFRLASTLLKERTRKCGQGHNAVLCYRMISACLQEKLYLVDCSFALASCKALHRATVNKLQSLGQLLVKEKVQAA